MGWLIRLKSETKKHASGITEMSEKYQNNTHTSRPRNLEVTAQAASADSLAY